MTIEAERNALIKSRDVLLEHVRYLGTLGLLGECAVYVPEDLRECIEDAMRDACAADPYLRWKRTLNRIEIEVVEPTR